MKKPTREERIRSLIRRGIMPSSAERVVADVDANGGKLLMPGEAAALAIVTDEDIERAKHRWYYDPDVPMAMKRMLDARQVGNA